MLFLTKSTPYMPVRSADGMHPQVAWREFNLSAQLPWFIVTFEVRSDAGFRRDTLCFSRASDLAECIRSRPSCVLTDLICMLPPWRTRSRRWTARSVKELWRAKGDGRDVFVFEDLYGADFFAHYLEGQEPQIKNSEFLASTTD